MSAGPSRPFPSFAPSPCSSSSSSSPDLPRADLSNPDPFSSSSQSDPATPARSSASAIASSLSCEVIFGADNERLSIRHDAGASAAPYVAGTLLAARRVSGLTGLKRGLDAVMD